MVPGAADSSHPAAASAASLEGSEMVALSCSELLLSGARVSISPISNEPRRSRTASPRRPTSLNSPAASAPAVTAASPATKTPVKPSGGGGGGSGRSGGSGGAAAAVPLGPTAGAGAPVARPLRRRAAISMSTSRRLSTRSSEREIKMAEAGTPHAAARPLSSVSSCNSCSSHLGS